MNSHPRHTGPVLVSHPVCMVQLRNRLEEELKMSLRDYRAFIDEEMIVILRQMDSPSQIFDFLYLGSEWNASNLEELRHNGYKADVTFMQLFVYFIAKLLAVLIKKEVGGQSGWLKWKFWKVLKIVMQRFQTPHIKQKHLPQLIL